MGIYYNPVEDVASGRVGTPINTHSYNEAIRQLPYGHHLYALCDRVIFKLVVCVDDQREFSEFFNQYKQGYLLSFELVALSPEAHQRALRDAGL